jgi:transcriptional regulator with XRE-family HTH domain
MITQDQEEFARLLQGYRERLELTKAQLAQRAGVSPSFITYLERGQRRPSYAMLLRLMQALDLTASEKRALLQAAGYQPPEEELSPRLSTITEQLAELPQSEREELLEEFARMIGRWRELRHKRVRRVVIPWRAGSPACSPQNSSVRCSAPPSTSRLWQA